ncbi:MAG: hypothetical protein IKS28_03625 [Clostridia bacterium]|nr:hypothetical protein [Clostridia bacterium]
MINGFRQTGHLLVHYDTPEEPETLKSLFRAMGIRNSKPYERMKFDNYEKQERGRW